MTSPSLPFLSPTTIMPESWDLFDPYFTSLYEDIAYVTNLKDDNYYNMAIGSTAVNIINVNNFGAFIICISGMTTDLPTLTASLTKSSATASGSIAVLGHQAGTGSWAAYVLTITSTSTNFQIAHNNTGVSGNFNIRLIGTQ